MSVAFNIPALAVVSVLVVALAAVPVACWREHHLSRRERRAADRSAAAFNPRDYEATMRGRHTETPEAWAARMGYPDRQPALLRLPEEDQ